MNIDNKMNRHQRRFEQVRQRNKKSTLEVVDQSYGEDRSSHALIVEKKPPQSIIELAKRLQQPQHADILAIAQKGETFEECIGTIAAFLDIVLDGEYDIPDLAAMLVKAMDARGTVGNQPHTLDDRLVSVELVERKDSFELVLAEGTIAPPPTDVFSVFMREHGCKVCENRQACLSNNKCLGLNAIGEGTMQ